MVRLHHDRDLAAAEQWVRQLLAPYCAVVDRHKDQYLAFLWVDSFVGKMRAGTRSRGMHAGILDACTTRTST